MARVQLQLHALNMGKGPFLTGIPAYQEKNVARQVKATASHCGWRELRLLVEDGPLPSPGL